jgi:hypothetical protein
VTEDTLKQTALKMVRNGHLSSFWGGAIQGDDGTLFMRQPYSAPLSRIGSSPCRPVAA